MEGEFVRVSAPLSGQLVKLAVARGAEIKAGTPLFTLESASESAVDFGALIDKAAALAERDNLFHSYPRCFHTSQYRLFLPRGQLHKNDGQR